MQQNIEAYPLSWPVGYPRTKFPTRNTRFQQTSLAKCRDLVLDELRRLGATQVIMSTNIPLRLDGLPYAGFERRDIPDKGVAIYFQYNKKQTVLCCDIWDRWEDNFYAIAKTIDAMRGMERWGCSEMLSRMFTGFTALPEPKTSIRSIWDTLDITLPTTEAEVKKAYHKLALIYHPDKPDGNADKFAEVNDAYLRAMYILK